LTAAVASATPDPKSDEFWFGTAADGTPTVHLYYFFSPTCPHCQAAAPFIDEFAARSPWLEVRKYAVKDNRANARFYYETALSLGTQALSVPGFVFCRQVLIGYDTAETTGAEIVKALEACHAERLAHPAATFRQTSAAPLAVDEGSTPSICPSSARSTPRHSPCPS
jgi:thiol-disulfide isomerase/thioredoxin